MDKLAIVCTGLLILSFEALLLGIILGWFGVYLSFLQCSAIILLVNMIFGTSK